MATLETDQDEGEKARYILQRYQDRLKVLRLGQEYSQKDDIPNAVKAYVKYLQALADYYGVEEKNLKPNLFKGKNNVVEVLMISQVYWDLSKSYDRAPKLTSECQRCLNQFVLFSLGFKFQYLNSEMLRKYMKRRVAHNPKLFEDAYDKMRDNSKKCYIASHCFHEHHPIVEDLRGLKKLLTTSSAGKYFVEAYYFTSIRICNYLKHRPLRDKIFKSIIKPALILFSSVLRMINIKR